MENTTPDTATIIGPDQKTRILHTEELIFASPEAILPGETVEVAGGCWTCRLLLDHDDLTNGNTCPNCWNRDLATLEEIELYLPLQDFVLHAPSGRADD